MNDRGKILTGLVIFLFCASLPFWVNLFSGKGKAVPNPTIVSNASSCVASTEYMREHHMDLLDEWRDDVVRRGDRVHKAPDGRFFEKSLTNTCMNCHKSEQNFCSKCHEYTGVEPLNCWECHIQSPL